MGVEVDNMFRTHTASKRRNVRLSLMCSLLGLIALQLWSACSPLDTLDANVEALPTVTSGSLGQALSSPARLQAATVKQLFAMAGSHLQKAGNTASINVTCSVDEGAFCWFDQEGVDSPTISRALAKQITNELTVRFVETSEKNQVTMRCSKPANADVPLTCEVQRWNDWEPLQVD